MFLTNSVKYTLRQLVEDLVSARYQEIENSGRSGRLSAAELEGAISSYGRTLTTLPEPVWDVVDVYPSASDPHSWHMDLPLWTKEEGRSDLMLMICITKVNDKIDVKIEDVRVP